MRQRAFTLIEMSAVTAAIGAMTLFMGMLVVFGQREFVNVQMLNSLKAEGTRASEQVFHLVATSRGYQVDADNHGLTTREGAHVRWRQQCLEVQQPGQPTRSLLPANLVDCTVVRHGGSLTLNFVMEAPTHFKGSPTRLHEVYDYPRVGLP